MPQLKEAGEDESEQAATTADPEQAPSEATASESARVESAGHVEVETSAV